MKIKSLFYLKLFSFTVEGIDEWVGLSGINIEHEEIQQKVQTTIQYSPLEEVSLNLNNGMKLLIIFSWTRPGFPHITEAKITQKTYFKLVSPQERPLDDFTSIIRKVTTFLCFAIDKTVCIDQIVATVMAVPRDIHKQDANNREPKQVSRPLYS